MITDILNETFSPMFKSLPVIGKETNKPLQPIETIGEMVARDARTAEVFKKWAVDFCCGGKRP
jgi:hypothetical protein